MSIQYKLFAFRLAFVSGPVPPILFSFHPRPALYYRIITQIYILLRALRALSSLFSSGIFARFSSLHSLYSARSCHAIRISCGKNFFLFLVFQDSLFEISIARWYFPFVVVLVLKSGYIHIQKRFSTRKRKKIMNKINSKVKMRVECSNNFRCLPDYFMMLFFLWFNRSLSCSCKVERFFCFG